ncbi:MAG: NrfD/PsrC family molybdoenzyme membrane anchor subunit [Dehalococcoidia bacterium]|nr:NrfD/PsrC family molybdoenzyme membrane anchor subunit [Dehalococcoidia bacterium]
MPVAREFTVDYLFQEQWGLKRRNLLIMLAFYFGGIGGGLYLVSLFAGYSHGALIGLLIAGVGKSLTHIFFLGRPDRFWRAVWRPQSSWISRGFIFFAIFLLSGLAYVLPQYGAFAWLPWTAQGGLGGALFWVSVLTSFLTITYTGLLMNRSAIPFWNNSLLPALFGVVSLWTGASLAGFFERLLPQAGVNLPLFKQFGLWGGAATLALLLFYLMGSYSFNLASKRAVRTLALNPGTAWFFYGLFLIVGICIPVIVYAVDVVAEAQVAMVVAAELLEILLGAVLFRYIFFRGGVFLPVY